MWKIVAIDRYVRKDVNDRQGRQAGKTQDIQPDRQYNYFIAHNSPLPPSKMQYYLWY